MRTLFNEPITMPTRVGLLWCSVGEFKYPELTEPNERLGSWDDDIIDGFDESESHAETVWYMGKDLPFMTWPEQGDAVQVFELRHISVDNIIHTGDIRDGVAVWLGHIIGQDFRWWEHNGWEVSRVQKVTHPGHSATAVLFGHGTD